MGASVLSMLLLLNASVTDWSNEKNQDTRNGKKGGDACGVSLARGGRIIGGRKAIEGEFPWMVHVHTGGFHCAGSIITPDIVVTAAHCLNESGPEDLNLQAGTLNIFNTSSTRQHRRVRKFLVHESYAFPANDIALLKLEVPFNFTESQGRIGAICLPPKYLPVANNVEAPGWGYTVHDGTISPDLLVVSIPTKSCMQIKIMFCAGSPGKGICNGDSGGPAVQRESGSWTLVGVVSQINVCGVHVATFTRVSAFIDWISENMVKLQS